MSKQYRNEAFAAIHEAAEGLYSIGVMDKKTMREYDQLCLTPVRALEPEQIRALRERERVSQSVFANYLNVTVGMVSKWERGEKKPSGTALKLLTLVEKHGLRAVA